MREFSKPINSTACERVFSLLEGMNRKERERCKMPPILSKLLFLRGNADIMRDALREANALRMKAAQAKAAQEMATSTSEWKAFKATNVQPINDAIKVDDGDEPVSQGISRKRLQRMVEEVDSEKEKKKQILEIIA